MTEESLRYRALLLCMRTGRRYIECLDHVILRAVMAFESEERPDWWRTFFNQFYEDWETYKVKSSTRIDRLTP